MSNQSHLLVHFIAMRTFSVLFKSHFFISRVSRVTQKQTVCKAIILFLLIIVFIKLLIFCMREIEVDGYGDKVSRKAIQYVYPDGDTSITYTAANICWRKPLIVIIICSNTPNYEQRQAIRETWAKDVKKFNMEVLFLVGISKDNKINMKTLNESFYFKDIIAEEFIDSYNNLTLKSIFMLKWVTKNCTQARFVMKVDDDAYVNVKNLYKFASQVKDEELKTFLVGKVTNDSGPFRSVFSKWYMPTYIYPKDRYPTYVHGVGYLMSTQVAVRLYNQTLRNEFIHFEDVYITGICAEEINLRPTDNRLFHYSEIPVVVTCNSIYSQMIVLSHHVDPYSMYKIYHHLSKCD